MKVTTSFLCITSFFTTVFTYKVEDNIIEKHDSNRGETFCSTGSFNQTILSPGCKNKIVLNNYCYGQCSSTFLQKNNVNIFECSVCKPVAIQLKTVDLVCSKGMIKAMQYEYVKLCACKKNNCKRKNLIDKGLQNPQPGIPEPEKIVKLELKSVRRKKRCRRKLGIKKRKCLRRWRKDRKRELELFREQYYIILQNLNTKGNHTIIK